MAASNPLHRDASASRQPSTHSLHCFTACNAALPSHKVEGLVGPLRPLSGSRSCGRPPRPPSLPFAHALRAAIQTKMGARGRSLRVRPCPWILQATTMRRTAGMENKIRTRVERREKPSDLRTPYRYDFRGRAEGRQRQLCSRRGGLSAAASLPEAAVELGHGLLGRLRGAHRRHEWRREAHRRGRRPVGRTTNRCSPWR